MSRGNIEQLLNVGENIPLQQVSPGTPQFRQSSFQGGQVQLGAPTQQVGPTSEEAMYSSLAEIAQGTQQGLDNFGQVLGQIEKRKIEAARERFNQIFASDYAESVDDKTTKTKKYLNPEEKLDEWNNYIKEVWTPLSGSTWIDEINTKAYASFGSREAQDSFEAGRYEREASLFFADPKNSRRLNQNSPTAKMEFDAYYSSKYPAATSNYWFKAQQQENLSQYQLQEDSTAKQALEESLSEILQLPPLEIAKTIAQSNSDESAELRDRYAVLYKDILPSIPAGSNQREVASRLINFYNKQLIENNPNQYQPHTLLELQRAIPKIAMQHAEHVLNIRSITHIEERRNAASQSLNLANTRMMDPVLWDSSKTNFFKSVISFTPYSGVSNVEQTNAVAAAAGSIWKQGYDTSTQALKTKVTRNGGGIPLNSVLYEEFPTLDNFKHGESTYLGNMSPNKQIETIAGFVLEEALTDPATANNLMRLYGVDNIPDVIKRYRSSVNAYIASSKEIQEANKTYYTEQDQQTNRVMAVMEQHGDLRRIEQITTDAIQTRAERNNLPLDLFRSIYVTALESGEDFKGDFNLDMWYMGLSPADKQRVDAAAIMYGSNRQQLETSAKQAFALELKAIDIGRSLTEQLNVAQEKQQEALDKNIKERNEHASKLNNKLKTFNIDITDPVSGSETGGDLVLSFIEGRSIFAEDPTTREIKELLVPIYEAFQNTESLPKNADGTINYEELNPVQKAQVDLLGKLNEWQKSEIPSEKELAERLMSGVYGLQVAMSEARIMMESQWIGLQESQHKLNKPNEEFDTEKARADFNGTFKNYEKSVLTGGFSFNGQFSNEKALNPDGTLSQYSFNWLASAYTFAYRSGRADDQRVTGVQHNEQIRTTTESLINAISVNNNPDDFIKNPSSVLPYLGFVMFGKGLNRAIQERGILPASSGAGWFVDRIAMIANGSSGINMQEAIEYFSSPDFRAQASYIQALPFVFSSWSRDSSNPAQSIFVRTAATQDQFNQANAVRFTPILFARAAITQPSLESLGISDPNEININDIKNTPEDLNIQLNTIIDGKTLSPKDPEWNPNLAFVLFQKSGLVPENMTKEVFAMELQTRFLEGSIDLTNQNLDSDQLIRLAFIALERFELEQDRGFSNAVSMATNPNIGIDSSSFPLSEGKNKTSEFLGFLGGLMGIHAGYETAAIDQGNYTIGYNDTYANKTLVQDSPSSMTTMFSVTRGTADTSYSVVNLTNYLNQHGKDPLNPNGYIWEANSRFKPTFEIIEDKPVSKNGVPYKMGTILLESKPDSNHLSTMLSPYIQHLQFTDPQDTPDLMFRVNTAIQTGLEQPTMFDALVEINRALEDDGLPGFIRPNNLYTRNPDNTFNTSNLTKGSSEIVQQKSVGRVNSMGFTFSWINENFNGTPMLHIPNRIWNKPLEFTSNPKLEEFKEKEKRKKELTDFQLELEKELTFSKGLK
jgi:hypothetical protein